MKSQKILAFFYAYLINDRYLIDKPFSSHYSCGLKIQIRRKGGVQGTAEDMRNTNDFYEKVSLADRGQDTDGNYPDSNVNDEKEEKVHNLELNDESCVSFAELEPMEDFIQPPQEFQMEQEGMQEIVPDDGQEFSFNEEETEGIDPLEETEHFFRGSLDADPDRASQGLTSLLERTRFGKSQDGTLERVHEASDEPDDERVIGKKQKEKVEDEVYFEEHSEEQAGEAAEETIQEEETEEDEKNAVKKKKHRRKGTLYAQEHADIQKFEISEKEQYSEADDTSSPTNGYADEYYRQILLSMPGRKIIPQDHTTASDTFEHNKTKSREVVIHQKSDIRQGLFSGDLDKCNSQTEAEAYRGMLPDKTNATEEKSLSSWDDRRNEPEEQKSTALEQADSWKETGKDHKDGYISFWKSNYKTELDDSDENRRADDSERTNDIQNQENLFKSVIDIPEKQSYRSQIRQESPVPEGANCLKETFVQDIRKENQDYGRDRPEKNALGENGKEISADAPYFMEKSQEPISKKEKEVLVSARNEAVQEERYHAVNQKSCENAEQNSLIYSHSSDEYDPREKERESVLQEESAIHQPAVQKPGWDKGLYDLSQDFSLVRSMPEEKTEPDVRTAETDKLVSTPASIEISVLVHPESGDTFAAGESSQMLIDEEQEWQEFLEQDVYECSVVNPNTKLEEVIFAAPETNRSSENASYENINKSENPVMNDLSVPVSHIRAGSTANEEKFQKEYNQNLEDVQKSWEESGKSDSGSVHGESGKRITPAAEAFAAAIGMAIQGKGIHGDEIRDNGKNCGRKASFEKGKAVRSFSDDEKCAKDKSGKKDRTTGIARSDKTGKEFNQGLEDDKKDWENIYVHKCTHGKNEEKSSRKDFGKDKYEHTDNFGSGTARKTFGSHTGREDTTGFDRNYGKEEDTVFSQKGFSFSEILKGWERS